jgi:hypothetical protein
MSSSLFHKRNNQFLYTKTKRKTSKQTIKTKQNKTYKKAKAKQQNKSQKDLCNNLQYICFF